MTGTPWFGLFLPQLRMSFDVILERTLAAEAAGFDSVWLMDHLAAPAASDQDTFEGWTLAAALAARTTTIRIGHLVTCDPFRHPAVLAKMAATVDVLSGGRLELGIGWGSVPEELDTYGIDAGPPATRAARLAETLTVLDLMFSGERFDFDGDHVTLRGAIGRPVPVQQPRPPVHLGGAGPKLTMPLVRAHADWWNCPTYAIDRLAELLPLAGTARVSTQHPVALARDAAERDDVVATGTRRFGAWGGLVGGTAAEVGDALAAEVALGVEGFVLQFTDFGTPATIEHFMAEVAPTLRISAAHQGSGP
jgi:alkanesulfonate monooxygenase SsuD/methylene tetrahydromethanopterin reductase-like flavin-dependent oxidoreductase (luciferase family)